MALAITNESKNNLTITNESKTGVNDTFAQHPETFAEQDAPFGAPGFPISNEAKNTLTISNDAKN